MVWNRVREKYFTAFSFQCCSHLVYRPISYLVSLRHRKLACILFRGRKQWVMTKYCQQLFCLKLMAVPTRKRATFIRNNMWVPWYCMWRFFRILVNSLLHEWFCTRTPKPTFFPPKTALWHLTEISNKMCGQGSMFCLFNKSGLSHAEKTCCPCASLPLLCSSCN